MEYMKKNGGIIFKTGDFDLSETFDCGQAFRFSPGGRGWRGFHLNYPLEIYAEKDYFVIPETGEEAFLKIWAVYLDLYTDYSEYKRIFSEDETLSEAIAYAGGIRILRQDAFEALFSFIISQNNNIPRIKGIISRLCERFGGFPSYPDLKGMSAEDFSFLRAGFRAGYLADCVGKLNSGEVSLDAVAAMPSEEAAKALVLIKGVGPKVADCTLLYGMYRIERYPVDVWIKRALEKYYPDGLPDYIKPCAGIAQQYLFHYIRNNG